MALDFFAGCVGGCAGVLVGHPLDTVKVRIQTQDFRNPIYRGTWHCLTTVLKTESVKGLYRGVTSPMGGVAMVNAIIFGVYGSAYRALSNNHGGLATHFVAGAGAGLAQSFICSPMELVKTRLQVQKDGRYRGAIHCLKQTYLTEGTRGVFKGLGLTCAREVPAFGTYFLTYEWLTSGERVSTAWMLLSGGLAGTASWVISYPQDVIKTRIQSDGINGPARYTGCFDCLRKSVATEGYSVLIRGLNSTIVRAFPTNAVTFTTVAWVFRIANRDANQPSTAAAQEENYRMKSTISIKLKKNIINALHYCEAMHEMDIC